jgi:hypothetical protein
MGKISAYIIFVGKLEGKWHMEVLVLHGMMILKSQTHASVNWLHLVHNRDQWRALVNTVKKLRVP